MSGVIDHVNVVVKLDALQLSALDLASATFPLALDWTTLLTNGTGANQASQVWSDQRTLTASATENLDLAASLTNAFGTTLTFTKVKLIMVKAAAANTNSVQVQRGATNGVPLFMAASDGIALTPGAWFIAVFPDATGVAVTASTGDILTITNSAGGTSVVYDIVLIGVD